jgi:hypothetical protein
MLAGVAAAALGASATAQSYPSKPIRMVVPAAPGGVTDIVARAIAPQLTEALGQSVVVDNRAGAGGIIGTDTVAKATPDGHTLLAVFDSFISNPFVFNEVPYDTIIDFAGCTPDSRSAIIRGASETRRENVYRFSRAGKVPQRADQLCDGGRGHLEPAFGGVVQGDDPARRHARAL